MNFRALFAAVLACAPFLPVAGSAACGGGAEASGVASATLPKGASGLDHESCDEAGSRVEVLDSNNDGKPDIRRVFDKQSGHEICRVSDLNHDGHPDLYEYFDASGAVRRRELCFDDTGIVNAVEHYDGGRLTKREFDTGGQHKIDTWDYFEPGLPLDAKTGRPVHPSRRERDTKGDGKVDQWWTWSGEKISIARDVNGDGKPDPESAVVLDPSGGGGTSAAPPASSGANTPPPAPSASNSDAGAPNAPAAQGGKP